MAQKIKDWGPRPSPQDVAEQMNAIEKLQDDLADTEREYSEVGAELARRNTLLRNARAELGRMLKARSGTDLRDTDFRVVHRDEVRGDGLELFGIYAVGTRHG